MTVRTSEIPASLLLNLAKLDQPVDRIVVYFQKRGAPRREPRIGIAQELATDPDYQELRTTMTHAVSEIMNHNYDTGLTDDDMDLAHALDLMKQSIIFLHSRTTRENVEEMFDVAKEDIFGLGNVQDLDVIYREQLSLILDLHWALACDQIDNPQPESF